MTHDIIDYIAIDSAMFAIAGYFIALTLVTLYQTWTRPTLNSILASLPDALKNVKMEVKSHEQI